MIAFDTNYVIRHLVADDAKQAARVAKVIQAETSAGRTILLPDLVLCEVMWVLDSCYDASKADQLAALDALMSEAAFEFQNTTRIQKATRAFRAGKADFSDYLINEISRETGRTLLTFDKLLAKEIG